MTNGSYGNGSRVNGLLHLSGNWRSFGRIADVERLVGADGSFQRCQAHWVDESRVRAAPLQPDEQGFRHTKIRSNHQTNETGDDSHSQNSTFDMIQFKLDFKKKKKITVRQSTISVPLQGSDGTI